ncbi:Rid family hydrolase [Pelagicoccus sp. SDUM812002]|uniref:Rid family hydrolase n=1 Tax=Pelagicoccus sp. SDUM812002 TaxID=3041266 RepID=UPI0028101C99|nr:Rid family hydrolase [Pelagicoccus sp. SDUM812002]MDQ8186640.1 Rid family hydrolase [Pelagicoccus sp. SDUM812002]
MITTNPPSQTDIKEYPRISYTDCYITVRPSLTGTAAELAEDLYGQLIPILKEKQIQVIQEKVHGNVEAREAFDMGRQRALGNSGLDCYLPYTYLEGRSLGPQEVTSIQIWGVRSHDGAATVRTDDSEISPARVLEGEGFQLVYCPRIHGFDESNPGDKGCVTRQCEMVFDRIEEAMSRYDLTLHDVARTWFYSRRLLDWYGEFNCIRTKHFKEAGIYATGKDPVFPASTGIQGRFSDEEIFVDVLGLGKGGSENAFRMEQVVTTSRQHQAFGYGSAFSRAMAVCHEGFRAVYVSGTASINTRGESTYIGNAEMQALDTLLNIAALLGDQGGGLADVCTGTVYCKNREAYAAYRSVLQKLRIADMPLVCVEADVCRHELLIEIELVAVIKE